MCVKSLGYSLNNSSALLTMSASRALKCVWKFKIWYFEYTFLKTLHQTSSRTKTI